MVWGLRFLGLITAIIFLSQNSTSALSEKVLISQVQTGGQLSASEEFVELHNPNNEIVDMNGWKLSYFSSSGVTEKVLYNFELGIESRSYILLVSEKFSQNYEDYDALMLTSGFSASGGHIVLFDDEGVEVDRLGWGTATLPETESATPSKKDYAMWRKFDGNDNLIDTNNNLLDFEVLASNPRYGGITEIEEEIVYPKINITELFPNPSEVDDAEGEFIELYNPNQDPVNLTGYVLQTGDNFQYKFTLPSIEITKYIALFSVDTHLVLSNSSSKARLLDPNGKVVSQTDEYSDVDEDESWALFDNWQVTNQPTPGQPNLQSSEIEPTKTAEKSLESCPEGKFRNPETNRCKMIEIASTFKPCTIGQFRNPETNRCKSLESTSSTLKPCAPDQFRNPETNRCKKKGTETSLKPCEDGQERNPETNRCRKVLGESISKQDEEKQSSSKVSIIAIAVVSIGALSYIAWEYRKDIKAKLFKS